MPGESESRRWQEPVKDESPRRATMAGVRGSRRCRRTPMPLLDPSACKAAYEAQLLDAGASAGDGRHGGRVFRAMLRASQALPGAVFAA